VAERSCTKLREQLPNRLNGKTSIV
jgi:hypothetical protein